MPIASLAAVSAVLYAATLASTVLGGDNAEFVTIFARGGVAHPSGYPLYSAWLRAWGMVWWGTPATGASLATAVLGVLATATLASAARRWGASTTGALFAGSLYALSPLVWSLNTHAEVFALHALLGAAVLWAAGPTRGRAAVDESATVALRSSTSVRAFALGLLGGFGLCNNHTLVLLAPIGLIGLWQVLRHADSVGRSAAAAALGLVLGLLPIAAMPAMATTGAGWVWGDLDSFGGVVHHVLRRDFGTFQLGIYDGQDLAARHVANLGAGCVRELTAIGVGAAVVGLAALLVDPLRRAHGAGLLAAMVVAGPGLLSRFNLAPDGIAVHVVERFWVLPIVLLSFAAAFGFDRLASRVASRLRGLAPLLVVLFAVARIPGGLVAVGEHHDGSVELYLRDTAAQLEPETVLIGTGDHRLFGFLWLREVAQERRDVVYIDASMLLYRWYFDRVTAQVGAPLDGVDHSARSVSLPALIAGVQRRGRPVAITNVISETIPRNFALVPMGTVLLVLAPGAPAPGLAELAQANQRIASSQALAPAAAARQSWSALVRQDYARPWSDLAAAFERAGAAEPAAQARALSEAWTQTYDP